MYVLAYGPLVCVHISVKSLIHVRIAILDYHLVYKTQYITVTIHCGLKLIQLHSNVKLYHIPMGSYSTPKSAISDM